jgi:FAD/FMN-containing dehydrogenase
MYKVYLHDLKKGVDARMKLQQRISGRVVDINDDGYESTRQAMAWNALKPDRRPELIVQVASEQDVIETVNFARENKMKIAVRGGGHSWCGSSIRDGGILLDLSRLNAVEIDPEKRVATVQPVVTNREFARKLAKHDLAFPFGHCPSVPISGYILGGGLGWNTGFCRKLKSGVRSWIVNYFLSTTLLIVL